MPAASTVCSVPRCPSFAVHRSRCQAHRLSDADRGLGAEHRRDRRINRPGATCEACGCSGILQRDHRVPASMGGSEAPSNKRWLCRCPEHGCHDRIGVRIDRDGDAGQNLGSRSTRHPRAHSFVCTHLRRCRPPEHDRDRLMPPTPKRPDQRQRRNRTTTAAQLEAAPATRVALPDLRDWQPATRAWWETIWASPMADEWVDGDVPGLTALAVLVDTFWLSGDSEGPCRDPDGVARVRPVAAVAPPAPVGDPQRSSRSPEAGRARRSRRGRATFAVLTGSKAG